MNEYDQVEDELLGADPEEVLAAARGDYGDEAQAQALNALGLEFDGGEPEGIDTATEDYLLNEAGRLEQRVGRVLTNKEFEMYAGELLSGADPGAVNAGFAQAIGGRTKSEEGRRELMTETMEDVSAEQEATEQAGVDEAVAEPEQ